MVGRTRAGETGGGGMTKRQMERKQAVVTAGGETEAFFPSCRGPAVAGGAPDGAGVHMLSGFHVFMLWLMKTSGTEDLGHERPVTRKASGTKDHWDERVFARRANGTKD